MQGILGVDALDTLLGKVPDGARILITCPPDVDGRSLLVQAAHQALNNAQAVVYMTTARPPNGIQRAIQRLGQTALSDLHFIDAYSGRLGSPDHHALADPKDLATLLTTLDDLADDHPDALLCVESLSSLVERSHKEFVVNSKELLHRFGRFHTTLALHVDWPGLPDVSRVLSRFDAGLQFYGIERKVVRNQAIKVDHISWMKRPDVRPRLVTVRADGALKALIPKVVITGPPDAGKTTFVHNVATGAAGTERSGTTVAMDKGRFEDDDVQTELFGTPGHARFDAVINTLLEQAAAVIVLVDSTDPSSFDRAEELLRRVQRRGLHVVVCGNKQDAPDAMAPTQMGERFGVPVIPVSANDPTTARKVMTSILTTLLTEAPA